MPKRASAGSKGASAGAAWALAQAPAHRPCETCRWAARNRAGARFLRDVLALRDAGRARVSIDRLRDKLHQDFAYEPSMWALRTHVRGRHEA